jgi:hypothetical protein
LIAIVDAHGRNRCQSASRNTRKWPSRKEGANRQSRGMLLDIFCWQDRVCLPPRKPNRKEEPACYAESR